MFQWIHPDQTAGDEKALVRLDRPLRFAAQHHADGLTLFVDLEGNANAPTLQVVVSNTRIEIRHHATLDNRIHRFAISVPPSQQPNKDDEVAFTIRATNCNDVPACDVVLRRTAWGVQTALLDGNPGSDWRRQMRAALLWHGWNRFVRLDGLKRFTSGLSGSEVLAFQPMLHGPNIGGGEPTTSWGSFLLVKSGPIRKIRKEWQAFRDHLRDRMHPFMARCEECLVIAPAGEPEPGEQHATIVGSFLGGDLLHVESLRSLIRGPAGETRCLEALDKLFQLLDPWHRAQTRGRVGDWHKMIGSGGKRGILLFGRCDLAQAAADKTTNTISRREYAEPLSWDTAFITELHLEAHLLGAEANAERNHPDRPGLLHRIRDEIDVHFSVTHGDLHPENILAGANNVWLLDFGEAGNDVPSLFDYAKLEVFIRLWCLELDPAARELDDGVAKFEKGLLDVLLGTSSGLENVDELALRIGARPPVLRKISACITWIRRRSVALSTSGPDRRDYLAVLYLTVLQTLRYAGQARDLLPNFRMLVTLACLLEDKLSRLLGMAPFERGRGSLDYKKLITPEWLKAPNAPARIAYFMNRPDGRRTLPFLDATRGVMQSQFHHLDVFDHTLVVMACLEVILDDPVKALCDPSQFELTAAKALRKQRLHVNGTRSRPIETAPPNTADINLDAIRKFLDQCVDDKSHLLLKWVCLLHDVGKPATRSLAIEDGETKVQFRGHEAYGVFLAERHLQAWFPDESDSLRIMSMIRKHHEHHQQVAKYFPRPRADVVGATPDLLAVLRQNLVADDVRGQLAQIRNRVDPNHADFLMDFPLLLLHGYADAAGCAGPECWPAMGQVAEMNLLLLSGCARLWRDASQTALRTRVGSVIEKIGYPPGKKYGELKNAVLNWALNAGDPDDAAIDCEARRIWPLN